MHVESILPGPLGKGAGFGSTILWRTGSFSKAFMKNRASEFSGSFNYAENEYCRAKNQFGKFECYFRSQSFCDINISKRQKTNLYLSRRNLLPRAQRDGPPRDKRFDLLPKKLVANNLFMWRSEQIRWLMRLNEDMQLHLNVNHLKARLGFEDGIMIGMHVRHGDGCLHGRRRQHGCRNLSEFVEEARTLRDFYGLNIRKIYLATDSDSIIEQVADHEHEFTFLYQNVSRKKFESSQKIENRFQIHKMNKHQLMVETLIDIFLLSECSYFVTQQASALSRIALSLASSRLEYIPPYISLDGPWCYHWKMCCDVKINGQQKTC
jgi:hypothetical protein